MNSSGLLDLHCCLSPVMSPLTDGLYISISLFFYAHLILSLSSFQDMSSDWMQDQSFNIKWTTVFASSHPCLQFQGEAKDLVKLWHSCATHGTMNKLKHTHREMKAGGNSKKWKREAEKREERTKDELCGGIYTERIRKIGELVWLCID